ncbi:MAG: orotate phosphoribosyltransferase [Candidatus Amulumruptor caecigallinarius]|nr:orotate phosphoribosyltransferase [Candidatus Amulumruptor caecigallinarius]
MKKPDRILAEKLLEVSAVKLQPDMPFVWGSGWNSPIYNDNRRILSYPDVRNYIKVELAKWIVEANAEANVIAAVSTAAIPFGMLAADALGMPFIYIRNTPKDHGLENMIEGDLRPGQKVVLVEDIVSTGGGTINAAENIRLAGGEVTGGVCLFNYEFPAAVKRLREADVDMNSLCSYNTLVEIAIEINYIRPSEEITLKEWRKDPANWVPE